MIDTIQARERRHFEFVGARNWRNGNSLGAFSRQSDSFGKKEILLGMGAK